ncbi:MAG: hypothetical protein ACTSSH_07615 [Candidatus Heimdallarchaeota archaeon]
MFEKLKHIYRRRKAISSNVVTILLIILTITFSAIIYFVVVPLLDDSTDFILISYELEDTNSNNLADKINATIHNIDTLTITLSELTVKQNGIEVEWDLAETYEINPDEQISVICSTTLNSEEFEYTDLASFQFPYKKKIFAFDIRVSARFSDFSFIYEEEFDSFNVEDWALTLIQAHYPDSFENISDWQIKQEDNGGNNYWQSTSNNCHFVVNKNPLLNFSNVNMSFDLRTDDDDANGFIYRYNDTGPYPNFYVVWYTYGHPSPLNGPHVEELDYFDWDTHEDQIEPGKITVHYVEGDTNGFNWYKIAEKDWTREYNVWHTWHLITNGNNTLLTIDDNDLPILNFTDTRISHGSIGFISFANMGSQYDNIFVWQTET